MTATPSDPATHVGRTRVLHDVVTAATLERMAATLDWPVPGGDLPPLWHWLFACPPIPRADMGPDGHERLGLFMPDIAGALRMWAGSDIRFLAPVRVGDALAVRSTIASVVAKPQAARCLWFVDVAHEWHANGIAAIVDRQTIVYRVGDGAKPARAAAAPPPPAESPLRSIVFDDLDLFRYSALTFNSHRIHLDRAFCQQETGDARLVVHGPLLATLAAHGAQELLGAPLTRFSFRSRQPVREGERIGLFRQDAQPDRCALQIIGSDGSMRLEAQAWSATA
ncbi:3-methylfumaryl-CoA hydratase [Novosphingobium sp. 1529]|uniref:acyl-CoA dehydrogenase n=1 Tax=Novosphingobium sp. 1529 TaxID=3156424 RepID=UPI001494938B